MLKKCFHIHYFYQTNPKNQPKLKTNLKKQPEKTPAHTKLLLLQPKRNPHSKKADSLNPPSQNCPFNNYQHRKSRLLQQQPNKQTQIYKPNQQQTLKNNQKKSLCKQDKPTTNKQKKHFSLFLVVPLRLRQIQFGY
jgi:hypothetical protein